MPKGKTVFAQIMDIIPDYESRGALTSIMATKEQRSSRVVISSR